MGTSNKIMFIKDIYSKALTFVTACIFCCGTSMAATQITATLEHTGATYYMNGETYKQTYDAETERYNRAGGQRDWNGQAAMKFSFNLPAGKTVIAATLTWSTKIYGNPATRNNSFYYMNLGKDLDWNAFARGRGNMIMAMSGSPYTYFTNVELNGTNQGTLHTNVETDVTSAVQAVESQGYITLFVTNNAVGGDLYGKGSNQAPSLSITYADKRTVTFAAGDDATCTTTSLSCASEGSVTSVTLPAATDNDGAEFMGWYTAPVGGTRIGGAGDTYTPSGDITLYAKYDRAPESIAITGVSTIKYGATTTLAATLTPSNTVNDGIEWGTSDASIATVNANGVVTAKGLGTAVITAYATAAPVNVRETFSVRVESDYYGYTVNAVDGDGNILKELTNDTYATGTEFYTFIPKYVLVGNTLYQTAQVTSNNYYTIYDTPTADGYVINRPYTQSTVNNVVYYSEAENCSAFTKTYEAITNRTSNGGLAHNDYTYKKATTLVPGTYKIYAEGSNGNSATRICDFKVGEEVVFTLNITNGNNKSGSSENFTITEPTDLYIRCQGSTTSGLDYFYIVQDPVYHVTSNLQQFNFTKENIDGTIYTTANPVNSNGSNGTHNGVTGAFYNIKWESNYVTITVDGAIAFSIDAFHGNSKDTRNVNVYLDGAELTPFHVAPSNYTTSPIYSTGDTGTHTIKITGDGKDVYPADIVFYKEKQIPRLDYTNVAVKVGETQGLTLRLPHGCTFSEMTSSGDASKVTATFVRDDSSDSQGRKGTLTLTGLATTGNTPTTLTFGILSDDEDVYLSGSATITVDVLKSTLTLSYTDGDTGDESTAYVCNADESTPALPNVRLIATDENGNDVSLNTLHITYTSDDQTVATVNETTGNITIKQPYGNGTARITAKATSDDYDDAEAEYSITIQRGINWKIAEHPVFKDNAPAVRDTFHVCKNTGGVDKVYLVGTFGGWNRVGGSGNTNNTYAYPKTDGSSENRTDSWSEMKAARSSVDGFSKYRSGAKDACNENMYSSLDDYYYDVIYGTERFGWFKLPDNNTTHPFTLPVRGAYITLEPEVNGTLSVYIDQNGPWNTGRNDVYDNDGNFISCDPNTGKVDKFPDTAPFQFRPHAFFIVDQAGDTVKNVEIVSRTKVTSGISTKENNAMLEAFCANYACEKGEKFKCIIDENADGYNDVTNIGNWKEFKEYMSPGEQQRVYDNWSAGVNGAQVVTKLDNGAYLALDPGMVKYTFHVIAGQTYYVFSNFSKIGFAGVNFVPDDEHQPSGTLALSEDVAYEPSALKAAEGNNAVPMYETITLDRSFTANKWYTICLPFTITEREVENVFGKGTELIILDRVNVDEGHAQIFMTYHEIQSILAGYPYLIKPTQSINKIEVHNKAIDPAQEVMEFSNNGYTSKGVDGFCNPQVFSSALTGMSDDITASAYLPAGDIYLANNTLYISKGQSFQKGYRSYLKKENDGSLPAKSVSFNYFKAWEDEEEATAINVCEMSDEALQTFEAKTTNGVFSITGQKVSDTLNGLTKGIYIFNGRKVIVK